MSLRIASEKFSWMHFQVGSYADAGGAALFPRATASPHPGGRDEIAELSVLEI